MSGRRYIRHTGGLIEDTQVAGEVKLGPGGFRPIGAFGSEREAMDCVKAHDGKLREGVFLAITQGPNSGRYFVFPVKKTAKGDLVTMTPEEAGFVSG